MASASKKSEGQHHEARAQDNDPAHMFDGEDVSFILPVEQILTSVAHSAYIWDLETDKLHWLDGATGILGIADPVLISSGGAYAKFIESDEAAARHQAIAHLDNLQKNEDRPYRFKYRFNARRTPGSRSLWIEEIGRITANDEGKPLKAAGLIRVISDRFNEGNSPLLSADQDNLTGQLNRVRLGELISDAVTGAMTRQVPAAFLLVSVDHLSRINDTFGFHVGDEVIASVGRRLREVLREADSIGRYSSNKFGIILAECEDAELHHIVRRLMSAVTSDRIATSLANIPVTISIGAVRIPFHARSLQAVISAGLETLDQVKAGRSGGYKVYEPSSEKVSIRQQNAAMTDFVTEALGDKRVAIALQPIVNAADGSAAYLESLVRLIHADGTIVPASRFMEVAEKFGLSREIDLRVLELSVMHLHANPELDISINVSSLTTTDNEWIERLLALTENNPQIREKIIVEITETAALTDAAAAVAFVDNLKNAGCRASIDDFGSGYTSYRNIKLLKADILKIDGSFIQNIMADEENQIIVRNMVDLARQLNLRIVAEWVEDEATARFLHEMGIDYLQGYHFGEPVVQPKADDERDDPESEALAS